MRHFLAVNLLMLCLFPPALQAGESGAIALVGAEATREGRPLLWKNRDSDNRECEVAYFRGARYDFIGVINRNDTARVWMGLNTAGFALVHAQAWDADSAKTARVGALIKEALGFCGRAQELGRLLALHAETSDCFPAAFACLDAFGGETLFEMGDKSLVRITPWDSSAAKPGFLVRSDFTLTGGAGTPQGAWRYQRAHQRLRAAAPAHQLDVPWLIKRVARDLASEEIDPWPLPFAGRLGDAPHGFIPTRSSLNGHRTVTCAVIQGVRPGENPRLATMWIIPGEPVCGIALPLWPASGEIPEAFDGKEGSELNQTLTRIRSRFYPKKEWPYHLNTEALTRGRRSWFDLVTTFEHEIETETAAALQRWRRSGVAPREMAELQKKFSRAVLRAL